MKKLFLLLIVTLGMLLQATAQEKTVTGIVKDNGGAVLENATVSVKGTNISVRSGKNGQYSIGPVNTGATLVFSFVGYTPKEIKFTGNTVINMSLQTSTEDLGEVVVIGYGTQRKSDLSGSVAIAPVEQMKKAPVRNFVEALQGRIAGVAIASVDGQPGSTNNIVIRGNNSITQDNSPLYVIDGFISEGSNSNSINPDDIESISVLKDASATAIYGARGANGVIIVTTKSGKEGPPVINFSASYGIQSTTKTVPLMNPYEFVKYQLEVNPGLDTTVIGSGGYYYLRNGATVDSYKDSNDINWQNRLFRTAPYKNYNMSVTGGSAQTKYVISGSILSQDGIIINSDYNRYQGRVVLNQSFGKKFKSSLNVNYSHLEQSGVNPAATTSSATSTLMYSVWGFKPFGNNLISEAFDNNVSSNNDYRFNPIINQQNIVRKNNTNNLSANAFLEYAITKELKFKVSGGINTLAREIISFNDTLTSYGNPRLNGNGINGSINNVNVNSWLNENTLTYNKKYNKKSTLNVLAGVTAQGFHTSSNGAAANQLPDQANNVSWLSSGTPTGITSNATANTLLSMLGRATYNYSSTYILTASIRADGSSKFAPENHWSYFPSGAIAWKFANTQFIKDIKSISEGKLRVSYGLTGNNRVGDFDYLSQYNISTVSQGYTFGNIPISGLIPQTLGNPKLKWETTEQTNIGVDMGFLKNRINLTVDVYRKITRDLLLNANIPTSYGFSSIIKNVGKVQNQGLELSINTVNVRKKDFTWNTSFNISFNANKILELADNQTSLFANAPFDNTLRSIPTYLNTLGKSLGLMYGPIWDGVYQYSDFNKSPSGVYSLIGTIPTNGNVRSSIKPGDIRYKDINGDGTINNNDFTVIGRGLPKHVGGFTNDFSYKQFDLSIFFQWSYGNDLINANRLVFEGNALGKTGLNQYASYADRWSPDNASNTLFRTGGQGPLGNTFSSRVVEDGSYLRLKTISLGYNLSKDLIKRIGFKNLNIYVAAQNLYTWTNYSGNDPEVSIFNSVLSPGVDYSAYPRANNINFGIKASL